MVAGVAQHLWQSTLFLIAAWVLTWACRRNSAAIRYWIWLVASVKFLVPFALLQWLGEIVGRSLPKPPAVDLAMIEVGNAIFVPSVAPLVDAMVPQYYWMVGALWALGTATLLLRWFVQWRAVHMTVLSARQMAMDLPVPVRVTSGDLTPGVFGVFRPVVVLPDTVVRELSSQQMQALLAHEMCHVRRRDNLTAAIHKCVEALFWFHPLVWWIGANLLREREEACDESVIEEGHEQAVYAESILHVCRLGVAAKFAAIAASTGGSLTQRLTSIMSPRRVSPIDNGRFSLLFATAMLACYCPIAAGVVAGAIREASYNHPISFDAIALEPAESGWRSSVQFDSESGQLTLKNVSLRYLISLAYPASRVNSDPDLIDRVRYDIEARWQDSGATSERHVYRELLKSVLRTNSNLQLYVSTR
jgi:beta-lactamase regulating signal transducer with metallopeptidase domain